MVLVVALPLPWLVASCGDDPVAVGAPRTGEAAAEAGRCPEGTSVDLQDPATLMSQRTYRRLDPNSSVRPNGDGSVTVDADGTNVTVAGSTWELFTAIDDPSGGWAAVGEGDDALLIAAVDGEEPFVVGTCMADSYTPFLRSAFEGAGATGLDDDPALLDEAVDEGPSSRLVTWFAARARADEGAAATTPWAERDPRARTINPAEAPADLRSRLVRFPLAIERPEPWSQAETTTICPFLVDTGWGDCSGLSGTGEDALIGRSVEAIPGTAVELWVLDGSASFASPIGRIATLDTAMVDELATAAGARTLVVHLEGVSPADARATISTRPTAGR